ncbi:hypothetical protein FB45DRAFT_942279 [Roridomyces roridus]|uniref:F-box domain-containing protein n=1 Tax=Roridomyces roridus TaxID=1738132 RepID=A0AAD7F9S3_9AGAR|nr:hypothetical protein FB45DRAFT_942279 [Roridomyces roridus]
MSLPQELIDSILDEVNDFASLKSCSLVASSFRYPSQRILYRCVRLQDNYGAIRTLLQDSPHIASYITILHISFATSDGRPVDTESLERILESPRLTNVRRCILKQGQWGELAELFPALIRFLSGQKLHELRFFLISGIPGVYFLQFLVLAPKLSFIAMAVEPTAGDIPPPPSFEKMPREMSLAMLCETVCELLLRPEGLPYIANLQALAITRMCRNLEFYGLRLISSVRNNLQHLHLTDPVDMPDPLPSFPALVRLTLDVGRPHLEWPWEYISTLLAPTASPHLQQFIFIVTYWRRADVNLHLQSLVDAALESHPNGPSMVWVITFGRDDKRSHLAQWVSKIQAGMPRLHASGRLAIEVRYDDERVARLA